MLYSPHKKYFEPTEMQVNHKKLRYETFYNISDWVIEEKLPS